MKTRPLLVGLLTLLVLAAVNGWVLQKERLKTGGQVVLLALAPRDPRSMLQGDYMALRYTITASIPRSSASSGLIVMRLDANQVASYVRLYTQGEPLAPGERLLRYHDNGSDVRVGPEAYFFQEGHAHYYRQARYGEFRLTPAGEVLLVALRGENFERLGPR